jgi:hypothetical protein
MLYARIHETKLAKQSEASDQSSVGTAYFSSRRYFFTTGSSTQLTIFVIFIKDFFGFSYYIEFRIDDVLTLPSVDF